MSKQIVTLWSDSDIRTAVHDSRTKKLFDTAKPQGAQLHARAFTLAKHGPALTAELLSAHPGIEVHWAIAGDWDDPKIAGHSDGWEECARAAASCGVSMLQLNCEVHWRHLPKGSAKQAVHETYAAAPTLPLGHTSYGSVSSFPDYPWEEFCGAASPVRRTAPQVYWARREGENQPRGYGIAWSERYRRAIQAGVRKGWIRSDMPIDCYLQAYDCRTDELCACSDDYPVTYWWAIPGRLDDAGALAIRAMSKLHRHSQSIEEYQSSQGLVPDGLVGRRTLAALGVGA